MVDLVSGRKSEVGDLHGQYWDFMNVLSMVGPTFGQPLWDVSNVSLSLGEVHLGKV